jgi:hypothetical protein
MKKIIYALFISLFITALFGCAPKEEEVVEIDFEVSLAVSGLEERVLSEADFNKMPFVEKTISRTAKDGTELTYNVKGILLKDVLTYLETTPDDLTLAAKDGYSQTYDQAMYNDELTIFVFFNDGEALSEEDGPIWAVAGNFTGNFWVRQLAKINLE